MNSQNKQDFVVISKAKPMNYKTNYVYLPKDYGSKNYFERADVQAIRNVVFQNLDILNEKSQFLQKMRNKKLILKPNLVGVFRDIGFSPAIVPQSTDPRVLDAIVEYFTPFVDEIIIAEASGSGFPTRTSFKLAGLDRLAKYRGIKLACLEEQPVERYYLPKAKAMKECLIPAIFGEVVRKEASYISIPKMKTNMYTEVTLGFKNAMGIIPLNLRQRDHNYNLEQKLVDLLFLLKPDVTIIDGIVGGQGQIPATAEPIESGIVISGTNVVETDSIATEIMGLKAEKVKLIHLAKKMGFGNDSVEIIGEKEPIHFKQADPSLMNDAFHEKFPKVTALIGHQLKTAPIITDLKKVKKNDLKKMELACRGGCLVATRMAFELLAGEEQKIPPMTIIIGKGAIVNGKGPYYFDREGKAYTLKKIAEINQPVLAIGSCTSHLKDLADIYIEGCLFHPGLVHVKLHKLTKSKCKMTGFKNKHLLKLITDTLKMRKIRRKRIKNGQYVDIGLDEVETEAQYPKTTFDPTLDFIEWELPEMTKKRKKALIKDEWKSLMILF
ncbi:MAG: DUF362 domain-containing protein [Candidatus Heimdallarchaeota archaeon]|nr:DUF362 domain-containing protein [Candidatus Heimdallarchaeota archaeon]